MIIGVIAKVTLIELTHRRDEAGKSSVNSVRRAAVLFPDRQSDQVAVGEGFTVHQKFCDC